MKKPYKHIVFLCLLLAVFLGGISGFVQAQGGEKHRGRLVALLENKIGIPVAIDGGISFSLGPRGLWASMRDITAFGPDGIPAARLGQIEIGWGFSALVAGGSFDRLRIKDSDLSKGPGFPPPILSGFRKIEIVNCKAFLPSGRETEIYLPISSLAFVKSPNGGWRAKGNLGGVPVVADIDIDATQTPATFDIAGTSGDIHVAVLGQVDAVKRRAFVSTYKVWLGESAIGGQAEIGWGPTKVAIRANIEGDFVKISDFSGDEEEKEKKSPSNRLFSEEPLPLGLLKAVDLDARLSVKNMAVGRGMLEDVRGRLLLSGGNLNVAPLKARIGASPVEALATVNAAMSPAYWEMGLSAKDIDLGDLLNVIGLPAFMTGKAGAVVRLAGIGNSPHEIVSSLAGIVSLAAEQGVITGGLSEEVSSLLASVLLGADNRALNCLAARFIVRNGIATDNGILADTSASTIAGKGTIDLTGETMSLSLRAKSAIAGDIPLLYVGGGLKDLHYSVSPQGVVRRFLDGLTTWNEGDLNVSVPEIQPPPYKGNACIYTLDHPKRKLSSKIYTPFNLDAASNKLENIGDMLNGLFKEAE